MVVIRRIILMMALVGCMNSYAVEQSTPYVLTDFPITLIVPDTAIWIKWTGATRNPLIPTQIPDSARIYYSKSPGGSVIANYPYNITKRAVDTVVADKDTSYVSQYNILFPGTLPQRGTRFRPSDNNMGAGVYYLMVAWKTTIATPGGIKDTTFYSNEIQLIVQSKNPVTLTSPTTGASITDLTPTFAWDINPGVPYYHVIVSDEKISLDADSGTVSGLSIIWQAITSNSQITYGAPDPSGTITADPPPISPGKEYSWAVLNNYGNHPAYSSTRFSLPSSFKIAGVSLKKPRNHWQYLSDTLNSIDNSSVTLQWRNLDSLANTYKVYIYMASDFEGIGAQMVVWSKEVTAGQFSGDTVGSVTFDAKATLTNNYYTWKVIAVDSKGGGTSSDTTGFRYNSPTGTIIVKTTENISVGSSVLSKDVGLVEVQVEVMDGSLEAPLLFYTDNEGDLDRERPVGTYKLTAIKDGFEIQTKTITLDANETETVQFIMKRPDATVYGKVLDQGGKAIGLARVVGVSDDGDTITSETDQLGNFVLSCYESDWSISASKSGYVSSLSLDTSVTFGQNVQLKSTITLAKNPFIFSGVIKNNSDVPLLGVSVKLLLDGVVVSEVPSTPQTGAFSFAVGSGAYTLTASKIGFTSYQKTFNVVASRQVTVTMAAGAALLNGAIMGRSWSSSYTQIFAPITSASILIIDTSKTPADTFKTVSGSVYGDYNISVNAGKKYKVVSSKKGFITDATYTDSIAGGKTYTLYDTLTALATIKGTVRMSDTVTSKAANVSVNVIDTATDMIVATATSDALGTFELRNIPNGSTYLLQAGGVGLAGDTIRLIDTAASSVLGGFLIVSDGLPKLSTSNTVIRTISITVKSGAKAMQWYVRHGNARVTDASIKLKSPLVKTLAATASLGGVGTGNYIVTIDAKTDTLLDCSYHKFTIPISADSLHTDTVRLPFVHYAADSLTLINDSVAVQVMSTDTALTSAYIYFKDINAQNYDSVTVSSAKDSGGARTYTFKVKPGKDGSYLVYYFKISSRNNTFGYVQETFRTFVKPDVSILTKIAVEPYSADTLMLPADAKVTFSFSGYYGSKFESAIQIAAENVAWSLPSATALGCVIGSNGKSAVITTPRTATGEGVGVLAATFVSTAAYKLAAGVSGIIQVYFKVSPYTLDSISVVRADASDKTYITNSSLDKAEFVAQGFDAKKTALTISPVWTIKPANAGTIDNNGVFRPGNDFVGYVRIFAEFGDVISEYNRLVGADINKSGLDVHYLIPMTRDTAKTNFGCGIVIPSGLIDAGVEGELSIVRPVLSNNKVELYAGSFDVITDAFDITELNDVNFKYEDTDTTDSIEIIIDVPAEYQKEARRGDGVFYIARWNADSLRWEALLNSTIASNGSWVRTRTTHFSQYSIMRLATGTSAEFSVKPNPFSPYVQARNDFDATVPPGTCLRVQATSPYKANLTFQVEIFNVVGDRVWAVTMLGAKSGPEYKIWWDGKTTNTMINLTGLYMLADGSYRVPGKQMCRNGRYFAVLTVNDKEKKKQYMKQIVLFK